MVVHAEAEKSSILDTLYWIFLTVEKYSVDPF